MNSPFAHLDALDPETGNCNAIIDTPKGSRNKFKLEEKYGLFALGSVLPAGAVFPFDFGFLPNTLGGDGDPIDVLVLMDDSAFVGCLVAARLIGVIEAEQTENEGETVRNDRLIAVADEARAHRGVRSLDDVSETLVGEIEHFFKSYNMARGKQFNSLGRQGPERAKQLVEEGVERARKER